MEDKDKIQDAEPGESTGAPINNDEAAQLLRKKMERLQKLRNLSFNISSIDDTNEFENVPDYIRRNMELYNHSPHLQTYFHKHSVKPQSPHRQQPNNDGKMS